MSELLDPMCSGWECKVDVRTGRNYYINHVTKTTTWDDPRSHPKSEYIPLQGIPETRRHYVHPGQPSPIPAFQNAKFNMVQDFRGTPRSSPKAFRGAKIQDSSFSMPLSSEMYGSNNSIDEAAAKISAMFPTVSDTHIRLLMKNCRYMKSIFPKADETLILDTLYNNDNAIQKSSEVLAEMGFQKKDVVKVALAQQKEDIKNAALAEQEKLRKVEAVKLSPKKVKSPEEKTELEAKLKSKYKEVPEHLIRIAMESVNFDEKRANQILEIIIHENSDKKESEQHSKDEPDEIAPICKVNTVVPIPVSQSRQSIKSLLKSDKQDKENTHRIIQNLTEQRSLHSTIVKGPNAELTQGPSSKHLLEDYVKWQGPNSQLRKGPQGLAKGSNRTLLSNRTYQAKGSNPELQKGPKFGLAKGSIFSQYRNAIGSSESRGK